jgi:hypothetical protein
MLIQGTSLVLLSWFATVASAFESTPRLARDLSSNKHARLAARLSNEVLLGRRGNTTLQRRAPVIPPAWVGTSTLVQRGMTGVSAMQLAGKASTPVFRID